jgi:periplasmic copper chaperone A
MKQLVIFLFALCAVAMGIPVAAQHDAAAQMEITEEAWVRSTPPNRTVTAAYLGIRNNSGESRRMTGAASPVAGRVELHTHVHDPRSGMMQMRHVEAIELPAGETVRLAPGGLHIMLMDLDRDLQPGATVPMTLEFDDGSRLELEAPVRRGEEAMEMHQSQDNDHHGHSQHRH